jgi:hypothetical protein
MVTRDQPGHGWTVVLRRQPVRIVDGRPEGGYTDSFEIVCCDCGDHPDLDYSEVPLELRRVRGPYSVADGIAAYVAHVGRCHPAPTVGLAPALAAGPNPRSEVAPLRHPRPVIPLGRPASPGRVRFRPPLPDPFEALWRNLFE